MSRPDYSPTPTVLAMNKITFRGNITPLTWYHHLKYDDGKAHLAAIAILADIVYWYRPYELRDERTGDFISLKCKFKGDMLQMGYDQFAERFGLTKLQAKSAIKYLIDEGLLYREFRTIRGEGGVLANNVMFVEPIPAGIERINEMPLSNPDDTPMQFKVHSPVIQNTEAVNFKVETNTESTTKTTTETTTPSMHANGVDSEKSTAQPEQTGMDAWMDELNDPKFNFLWDAGLRNEKTIRELIALPMETLQKEWAIVKDSTIEPKAKAGTLSRNLRIALTRYQIEQRAAAERAANPAAATPAPNNAHPDAQRYQRPDFITEAEWYGLRDMAEMYAYLDGAIFDGANGIVCRNDRMTTDLYMKMGGAVLHTRLSAIRNWQPVEDWA